MNGKPKVNLVLFLVYYVVASLVVTWLVPSNWVFFAGFAACVLWDAINEA